MRATFYSTNENRLSCYVCNTSEQRPLLHMSDAPYRYSYCHVDCFVNGLNANEVVVSEDVDETTCYGCGDILGRHPYCEPCRDSAYDNGAEEATNCCDECGEPSTVYCEFHAGEIWDSNASCYDCSDTAETGFCEFHLEQHDDAVASRAVLDHEEGKVASAMAASPYEAEWDDDD